MSPETKKRLCGNFCVVIHTDGKSEVKIVEEGKSVFEKAKDFIGCQWLEDVVIQSIVPKSHDSIVFLVNEEGYLQWGRDPAKVNQIATMLYNRGVEPVHYILGDVVICLLIEGEEGSEFEGLSYKLAMAIAAQDNNELASIAKEKVPRPETIPEPKISISSYESAEDLVKAMKGDPSVKPIERTILSGEDDGKAEA